MILFDFEYTTSFTKAQDLRWLGCVYKITDDVLGPSLLNVVMSIYAIQLWAYINQSRVVDYEKTNKK